MMSKNRDRKNKGLVRDDSCLKFKMKENVMTGRNDESGDTIETIDSPAVIKQKMYKPVESRFKKTTHEWSSNFKMIVYYLIWFELINFIILLRNRANMDYYLIKSN